MVNITKEQFINAKSFVELRDKYALDISQLKKELVKQGVWEDWHAELVDRLYQELLNNKELVNKINDKVECGQSWHSICTTKGASYKAIEKYLIENLGLNKSEHDNVDVEDYREQLEQIKTDRITELIAKEKELSAELKEIKAELKEFKAEFGDMLMEVGGNFNFDGVSVYSATKQMRASVGKTALVKQLGESKAKELFPDLWKTYVYAKVEW